MEPVTLGLIGCGTVGTGVARLLIEQRHLLEARTGIPLNLKYVADLDRTTDRGIPFAPGVFIGDARQILQDPQIDIVIEMVGGETFAKEAILSALRQGKHVVTANKALLAKHGNEILQAASANKADLGFEASVGGCMPVIKTLRESLVSNQIQSMVGILNGTCNYILTKISREGIAFEEALRQAQAAGFAEADPTLDVQGLDTAHKLAILTALAYGMQINFDDIYIEGISAITPLDIQFAREFGYCIKLLAISKQRGDTVEARVHPTMIPLDNILSSVSGSLNAVTISGHAVGDLFLSGFGAGMMPTGSAVLSDIVDLARNLRYGTVGRVPVMGYQSAAIRSIAVMPVTDIVTQYYFRFEALDQPNVLSAVSGILGRHGISIKSVHQKGRKTDGAVPIVMLTHLAREADVRHALRDLGGLDVIRNRPVVIRIENQDDAD